MQGLARVNVKMCETQEDSNIAASKACKFTQKELEEDEKYINQMTVEHNTHD